jgi:hypothetical protein
MFNIPAQYGPAREPWIDADVCDVPFAGADGFALSLEHRAGRGCLEKTRGEMKGMLRRSTTTIDGPNFGSVAFEVRPREPGESSDALHQVGGKAIAVGQVEVARQWLNEI